jgi:hypothetical protein
MKTKTVYDVLTQKGFRIGVKAYNPKQAYNEACDIYVNFEKETKERVGQPINYYYKYKNGMASVISLQMIK